MNTNNEEIEARVQREILNRLSTEDLLKVNKLLDAEEFDEAEFERILEGAGIDKDALAQKIAEDIQAEKEEEEE